MKQIIVLLLMLGGIWSSPLPNRQIPTHDWEFVLLDMAQNRFYVVYPEGSEPLVIPSCLDAPASPYTILSPDRRFIVIIDHPWLKMADLQQQTCFETQLPEAVVGDEQDTVYSLGVFSPEATQVAVSYASYKAFRGEIAVIDLVESPGRILYTLDTGQGSIGQLYRWTEEGLFFLRDCIGCEKYMVEGLLNLWTPDTGDVQATDQYAAFTWSDQLELTGESLEMGVSPEFLHDIPELGPPVLNVVFYRSGPTAPDAQVVFHDPAHYWQPHQPVWVLDGQAFLWYPAYDTGEDPTIPVWLVFRQGDAVKVDLPAHAKLLEGTPDGWIILSAAGELDHYRYEAGQVTITPLPISGLDKENVRLVAVQTPPLAAMAGTGFTPPPFLDNYQLSNCDHLTLPPRLVFGVPGHVADSSKPAVVYSDFSPYRVEQGTVTEFEVRDGPVCPDGNAWWLVEQGEVLGWTPESQNNAYLLAPTCPPPTFRPDQAWDTGLTVEFYGQEFYGDKGFQLFSEPDDSSVMLAPLTDGELITVVDGPVCQPSNQVWWQVDYNGLIGWVRQPAFRG